MWSLAQWRVTNFCRYNGNIQYLVAYNASVVLVCAAVALNDADIIQFFHRSKLGENRGKSWNELPRNIKECKRKDVFKL